MESASQLAEINAHLAASKLGLALVNPADLKLLDENARFMRNEIFKQLVGNIERDGFLASLPFCWRYEVPDKETQAGPVDDPEAVVQEEFLYEYLVLSGNHRVKAAKAAGLEKIVILYTWADLSEQERIAIQLSHNALVGEDDLATLKRLYERLGQVDLKSYAGLDDKTLALLQKVTLPPLSEPALDFQSITMLFLPEEVERLKKAVDRAASLVAGDERFAAWQSDFDRFISAISTVKAAWEIHNAATAIMLILDIFEAHQDDLTAALAQHQANGRKWVPMAAIFGGDRVPEPAAQLIRNALEKMVGSGELTSKNLWQALEFWAADYLGGE
jgi:hypothetical protein